jgi:putative transposase
MARLPRFVIPVQPQYVIARGNNRAEIFCADKVEIGLCKHGHGCSVHAYVLTINHVH